MFESHVIQHFYESECLTLSAKFIIDVKVAKFYKTDMCEKNIKGLDVYSYIKKVNIN